MGGVPVHRWAFGQDAEFNGNQYTRRDVCRLAGRADLRVLSRASGERTLARILPVATSTPSSTARPSASLRRWRRHSWLSRLPLIGWLLERKPQVPPKSRRKGTPLDAE